MCVVVFSMDGEEAILKTWRWIERAVIGANLCPFAQPSINQNRFEIQVSEAQSIDQAYRSALVYLENLLANKHDLESALLIFPNALDEFEDYLDCLFALEEALIELELEGIFQLASFHPHYQFEETTEDDQANWSNRSPYPSIHFLREDSISKALSAVSHPDKIPKRNVTYLRKLSFSQIKEIFDIK